VIAAPATGADAGSPELVPYLDPVTLPLGGADPLLGDWIRILLADARERTLWLVESVSEADLERVHDPLMSPLVWDLGHIAAFEDLWVSGRGTGMEPLRPDLMEVYDATETPRAHRGDLPYLRRREALDYLERVRERALRVLDAMDLSPGLGDLHRGGFLWEMLVQHEHQHGETMLQCLQLAEPGVYSPPRRALPAPPGRAAAGAGAGAGGMVRVDAGWSQMGDAGVWFAYDNERPRHARHLPAFEIDRLPVTNGDYGEFVRDGGYERQSLWTAGGWRWRGRSGAERPLFWTADGGERRFDRVADVDPSRPVMHVCWYEADAFARWAGKRLPTEAEWERAAAWDPAARSARRQPWGEDPPSHELANLDQTAFGPAPAGAYPAGASAYGVLGMVGDAWEWTASDFTAYPGFRAYPYEEYSAIFFGDGYKVLRGGSWATRTRVIRNTMRNWDLPERRQIFAGFRCARDA
jgi:iron(II)-dependent oxidoreductase